MDTPGCTQPKWRPTKKGRRCGQTCVNEQGKRRFRWVSGQECGAKPRTQPDDVSEFSGSDGSDSGTVLFDSVGALAGLLGVPVERLEPMPLVPLVGLSDGNEKRRSR